MIYGYSVVVQMQDPESPNIDLGAWRAVVIGDVGQEFAAKTETGVVYAHGETERAALHAAIDRIPFRSEEEEEGRTWAEMSSAERVAAAVEGASGGRGEPLHIRRDDLAELVKLAEGQRFRSPAEAAALRRAKEILR